MDRTVPPEELRVGVGPFADSEVFLASGRATLELAQRLIGLAPSHRVLDVACGCGRVAIPLTDFLSADGSYVGFDADPAYVAWCRENIQRRDPRFAFAHLDIRSEAYNPGGRIEAPDAVFPYADASFDAVLVSSVFTHMFESTIERYVSEIARVLRPLGGVLISALLMNEATKAAVRNSTTLFRFEHAVGTSSWTMDMARPTEAVAIAESWLLGLLARHDLRDAQTEYGDWRERRSWAIQHDWLAVRRMAGRAA